MSNRDWREKIKNYGFEIIDTCKDLPKDDTLYVTYCCAEKCKEPKAKVKDLYQSVRCKTFFKNIVGYDAGIISEKYGLVFLDDEVDNYDFGPKDLTEEIKEELRERLKNQIRNHNKSNLVLFGAPLMSMGFMNLLSKVECKKYLCYGTNRLNEIPTTNKKKEVIQIHNKKLF